MRIEEREGKFIITSFDELEAYEIACNIEKQGIHFYKKIAEQNQKPDIAGVLDFLVEEELRHLKFFENRLYDLRKDKNDTSEDNDLIEGMDFGIFEPYKSIEDLGKVLEDKKKAFSLGVMVEEKSITFYKACRDNISSSQVKEQLDKIINEEEKHKEKLKSLLSECG